MRSSALSSWLLAIALATAAPAQDAPGLPPTQPGREVLIDSRTMVSSAGRSLTLSDLDPETAEIVREINRKPGTWQMYLLYTAEDLPERMFHPGFAIRLPGRRQPAPPELRDDQILIAPPEGEPAPAGAPPPAATAPAPAPRQSPPR